MQKFVFLSFLPMLPTQILLNNFLDRCDASVIFLSLIMIFL